MYKLPSLKSKLWWYQFVSLALAHENAVLDLWIFRRRNHCTNCNEGNKGERGRRALLWVIKGRLFEERQVEKIGLFNATLSPLARSTLRVDINTQCTAGPVTFNKGSEIFSFKTNKCSIFWEWDKHVVVNIKTYLNSWFFYSDKL